MWMFGQDQWKTIVNIDQKISGKQFWYWMVRWNENIRILRKFILRCISFVAPKILAFQPSKKMRDLLACSVAIIFDVPPIESIILIYCSLFFTSKPLILQLFICNPIKLRSQSVVCKKTISFLYALHNFKIEMNINSETYGQFGAWMWWMWMVSTSKEKSLFGVWIESHELLHYIRIREFSLRCNNIINWVIAI